MRVDKRRKYDCSGCTACLNVCPRKCITMQPDALGFLYPKVNDQECCNCNLCEKVCPFSSDFIRINAFDEPRVYGFRLRSDSELLGSQSGGAFYALSEKILEQGGIIYGAGYTEHFKVVHKRVTTPAEREELRLSKYVQSDIRGIFTSVKADLSNGRIVLFSGTPCQIAGLQSYLGNNRTNKNLIMVDLVCHGVPSPAIWNDYLKYLEKRFQHKIISAIFRDKALGWNTPYEKFVLDNGRVLHLRTFRELFNRLYSVRYSCSNCPFANMKRVGDLTIGDFWGWDRVYNEFNDNKGVSLVLVNTLKGEALFQAIKEQAVCIESNIRDCLQPQLITPIQFTVKRKRFEEDYQRYGFLYVAKLYSDLGWRYKIRCLSMRIRLLVHKILKY